MQLSPGTRRALQIAGVIMTAAGAILTLTGFIMFASSMGDFDMTPPLAEFGMFAVGGFLLVGGMAVARFGFRKPLAEIAATDTAVAVEHSTAAAGRGFSKGIRDAGGLGMVMGTNGTIVKVKCRSCGYLDSEDAKFCSDCGKAL